MFLETQTPGKTETKADPFSLESLIAWLETMPVDKEYDGGSLTRCVLGQWVQSVGVTDMHEVRDRSFRYGRTAPFKVVASINQEFGPQTFGAALERARAALAA